MVTVLVFLMVLVVFDVLASRYGHDSHLDNWLDESRWSPLR
jgi:hypothetical protein